MRAYPIDIRLDIFHQTYHNKNTLQYMIDELQEEVDEKNRQLEEKSQELEKARKFKEQMETYR